MRVLDTEEAQDTRREKVLGYLVQKYAHNPQVGEGGGVSGAERSSRYPGRRRRKGIRCGKKLKMPGKEKVEGYQVRKMCRDTLGGIVGIVFGMSVALLPVYLLR